MKNLLLALTLFVLGSCGAWAGSVCPAPNGLNPFPYTPDSANTGCNVLITINANGTVTVAIQDSNPYENSEDILVGVRNNSSSPVGSVTLTAGAGNDIFGFDGDGMCNFTFVGNAYCTSSPHTSDPADYQGPTSTFVVTSPTSGTANFSPQVAANGGTTYFSLEGIPSASIGATVPSGPAPTPPTPIAAVPALSTWGILVLTILLMGLSTRLLRRA
jgi:hypothetical protein